MGLTHARVEILSVLELPNDRLENMEEGPMSEMFWRGIGTSSTRYMDVRRGEVVRGVWGGPLPHGSATPYDAIVDPPFQADRNGVVAVTVDWMNKVASVRWVSKTLEPDAS